MKLRRNVYPGLLNVAIVGQKFTKNEDVRATFKETQVEAATDFAKPIQNKKGVTAITVRITSDKG